MIDSTSFDVGEILGLCIDVGLEEGSVIVGLGEGFVVVGLDEGVALGRGGMKIGDEGLDGLKKGAEGLTGLEGTPNPSRYSRKSHVSNVNI